MKEIVAMETMKTEIIMPFEQAEEYHISLDHFERKTAYSPFSRVVRSCPTLQGKGVTGNDFFLTLLTSPKEDRELVAVLFDKNHIEQTVLSV